MKVVRKGGEELGLVGVVEIHYIYTVYNFGPYLGLFLSILSAVGLKNKKRKKDEEDMYTCMHTICTRHDKGTLWEFHTKTPPPQTKIKNYCYRRYTFLYLR